VRHMFTVLAAIVHDNSKLQDVIWTNCASVVLDMLGCNVGAELALAEVCNGCLSRGSHVSCDCMLMCADIERQRETCQYD
jgi:hypothetical protein